LCVAHTSENVKSRSNSLKTSVVVVRLFFAVDLTNSILLIVTSTAAFSVTAVLYVFLVPDKLRDISLTEVTAYEAKKEVHKRIQIGCNQLSIGGRKISVNNAVYR
jgi:hypothetical protein